MKAERDDDDDGGEGLEGEKGLLWCTDQGGDGRGRYGGDGAYRGLETSQRTLSTSPFLSLFCLLPLLPCYHTCDDDDHTNTTVSPAPL